MKAEKCNCYTTKALMYVAETLTVGPSHVLTSAKEML